MIVLYVFLTVLVIASGSGFHAESLLLLGLLGYLVFEMHQLKQRISQLERYRRGMRPAETPIETPFPTPPPPMAKPPFSEPLPSVPLPPEPAANVVDLAELLRQFGGDNPFGRLGAVILLAAVGFLLAYLNAFITAEIRLAGAVLLAVALVVLGQFLRRDIGIVLQGAGVGVGYLSAFAAHHLLQLVDFSTAVALMIAISLGGIALAHTRRAEGLAAFALLGGFLAPILTEDLPSSPALLFGFYSLLNGVIVGLCLAHPWGNLARLGALLTLGVGTVWGASRYTTDAFPTTTAFLVGFFALFIALAVICTARDPRIPPRLGIGLVFGVPLSATLLASRLFEGNATALALFTASFGAIYAALAWQLAQRDALTFSRLQHAFALLAVMLFTLTIPLIFDEKVTTALWGIEGVVLVKVALMQNTLWARVLGYLLLLGSSGHFLALELQTISLWSGAQDFLRGDGLSVFVIAASSLATTYFIDRGDLHPAERQGIGGLFWGYGLLWAGFGGWIVIGQSVETATEMHGGGLLLIAVIAGALGLLRGVLAWPRLHGAVWLAPAATATLLLFGPQAGFVGTLWPLWGLLFGVQYALLRRFRAVRGGDVAHLLTAVSVALAFGNGVWLRLDAMPSPWALLVAPWTALLALLLAPAAARLVEFQHPRAYHTLIPLTAFAVLGLWLVAMASHTPTTFPPLPDWPLVNLLDATGVAAWLVFFRWGWTRRADFTPHQQHGFAVVSLAMGVFLAHVAVFRAAYWLLLVPYTADDLLGSVSVQAQITVLWTALALAWLVVGHRWALRRLWLAGAVLMLAAVAKLLLFDLSQIDTLARIGAFFGAAVALLLAGTFAPQPPPAIPATASAP